MREEKDFLWFNGVLLESNKKVKFTQWSIIPPMKVGECCNCLDKKNPQQKYIVKEIINGVYYFEKFEYAEPEKCLWFK